MEDFDRKMVGDICIEYVNLFRATFKDADELKERLNKVINLGFKKVFVDISKCEFIDSIFLGVLLMALKEISKRGGKIHLVKPPSPTLWIMELVGILKIFNIFENQDEAVMGFVSLDIYNFSAYK